MKNSLLLFLPFLCIIVHSYPFERKRNGFFDQVLAPYLSDVGQVNILFSSRLMKSKPPVQQESMIGGWLPDALIHIFTALAGLPAVLHSVSIASCLLPLAPSFGFICLFQLRSISLMYLFGLQITFFDKRSFPFGIFKNFILEQN